MRHCFYHTGRPRTESSISQYKLHSFNIHKLLKNFPKSPIRPSGSHFCSGSCGECLNEHQQSYAPTLQRIYSVYFLFNGLLTRGILSTCTPASDVH